MNNFKVFFILNVVKFYLKMLEKEKRKLDFKEDYSVFANKELCYDFISCKTYLESILFGKNISINNLKTTLRLLQRVEDDLNLFKGEQQW